MQYVTATELLNLFLYGSRHEQLVRFYEVKSLTQLQGILLFVILRHSKTLSYACNVHLYIAYNVRFLWATWTFGPVVIPVPKSLPL